MSSSLTTASLSLSQSAGSTALLSFSGGPDSSILMDALAEDPLAVTHFTSYETGREIIK
jgi:PP-loop superfamily ATP-utilizing enzyme